MAAGGETPARPAAGSAALRLLLHELPDAVLGSEEAVGEVTIRVGRERLVEVARLLRDPTVAHKLRASEDAEALYAVLAMPSASAA